MATLVFGSQAWGYALVSLLILCGGVLLGNAPSVWRRARSTVSRVDAVFMVAIGGTSLWLAYHTGYEWFYALRVDPNQSVVISHLWPRGDVTIPIDRIAEIRVFHMFRRSGETRSPYVQIVLTNGQRIGSTSPLPPPEEIEREISSLPAKRAASAQNAEWTYYRPSNH